MTTIKERAKKYATRLVGGWYESGLKGNMWDATYKRYIEIATEQDQVSRKEEREKCVKRAQEWYCNNICDGNCIGVTENGIIYNEKCNPGCCGILNELRKAIEEEDNNDN